LKEVSVNTYKFVYSYTKETFPQDSEQAPRQLLHGIGKHHKTSLFNRRMTSLFFYENHK